MGAVLKLILLLSLATSSLSKTTAQERAPTCQFRNIHYKIGESIPAGISQFPCTCVAYKSTAKFNCDYSGFDGSSSADFPGKK